MTLSAHCSSELIPYYHKKDRLKTSLQLLMAFTSSLTNQFWEITSQSYYPSWYWCSPKFPALTLFSSVQSLSHAQLCDPMDCSTPCLPVHYQLLELAQTHIHWIGDAIQPFHPLSSPCPPAFNLSWHQGLFQWVSTSNHVAKYWSFSFSICSTNECSGLISFRMD